MKFRSLDNARYFRDGDGDLWRETGDDEFQLVEVFGSHVVGSQRLTRAQIESDCGGLTEEDNR